jgi:hypothetical protein
MPVKYEFFHNVNGRESLLQKAEIELSLVEGQVWVPVRATKAAYDDQGGMKAAPVYEISMSVDLGHSSWNSTQGSSEFIEEQRAKAAKTDAPIQWVMTLADGHEIRMDGVTVREPPTLRIFLVAVNVLVVLIFGIAFALKQRHRLKGAPA